MTTDTSTARSEWEQRLERYTALWLLFQADDLWGPLFSATRDSETSGSLIGMTKDAERAQWQARFDEAHDRHARELDRHMATIYDPLIKAALALVRTPAPDLDAVRLKHKVCNSELDLPSYEDEEGELFNIIRADVKRVTGVEA